MAKQIVDHIVLKCSFFIVKEDKVDNVNQATLLSSCEEHTFIIIINLMVIRFIVRGRIFDWYVKSHIYPFLSDSFCLESTKDFKVWNFVVLATQEEPKMI